VYHLGVSREVNVDHFYGCNNQSEFFPVKLGSQRQAKAFFGMLDFDALDALGVVIV
jgi:hypothetical protein